jgi:hypothetical protein
LHESSHVRWIPGSAKLAAERSIVSSVLLRNKFDSVNEGSKALGMPYMRDPVLSYVVSCSLLRCATARVRLIDGTRWTLSHQCLVQNGSTSGHRWLVPAGEQEREERGDQEIRGKTDGTESDDRRWNG